MEPVHKVLIIGGGAAGFFAAIRAAEQNPAAEVVILERGKDVLAKVKVSGGGRCNVTHACFVPRDLAKNYPRGGRELLGPFNQFACGDTIAWFAERGVETKIEADGRIFPVTDSSQTIIDCLWQAAREAGVRVLMQHRVDDIVPPQAPGGCWVVTANGRDFAADCVMIASGSNPRMWELLAKLGHSIVPPVPSLFTFNINDERITPLPGLSVQLAELGIPGAKLSAAGPLLVTHWGLSGPAILRLSAWGARALAEQQYRFPLTVNWACEKEPQVREELEAYKAEHPRRLVAANSLFGLPARLWQRLVAAAGIAPELQWANLGKKPLNALVQQLTQATFEANGKSTFKDEFVTAGGVALAEVDFKRFESRMLPGLFFAGEVLDIDAITGGFNFQAAWTGGYIAGTAMAEMGKV